MTVECLGPTNHSSCHYDRIWGSAGDVWIGDDDCSTKHFDAKGELRTDPVARSPEPQFPADFAAIHPSSKYTEISALSVASPNHVWVTQPYGAYYYDGTTWHNSPSDAYGPEEAFIQTSIAANEKGQARS